MNEVTSGPQFQRSAGGVAHAVSAAGVLAAAFFLSGCGISDAPVLNPKGPIALAERDLLFTAFGLMMIVAIPAILLTLLFVWRYRRSRQNSDYAPDWDGSPGIEAVVWLVPAAIVIAIGTIVWDSTHNLDPYRPISADKPAFKVQAVALDWKWLFLYPEDGVASVNELVFPADRPLTLEITSDTVMNSLMIPALGGQIYAMAGMRSELNLLADGPGVFTGRNTMYSGDGFADQHFKAHAVSDEDFAAWKDKAAGSADGLTSDTYAELHKKSIANPVAYYSSFEPDLFKLILQKYAPNAAPHEDGKAATTEGEAS